MGNIVQRLNFNAGSASGQTPLAIDVGTITIFVGPNNGGKSSALREIFLQCTSPGGSITPVVNKVQFSAPSGDWVEKELQRIESEPRSTEVLHDKDHCFVEVEGVREQIHKPQLLLGLSNRHTDDGRFYFVSTWLRHYVKNLDGSTRLNLLSRQNKGNLTSPEGTFSKLYTSNVLRESLWKKIFDAVGYWPFLHNLNGNFLELVASTEKTLADERTLDDRTIEHVRKSLPIEGFSDGIKAFVGVLVETSAGNPKIVCIDEPEAFLHPSLSETLGRELCAAAKQSGKQLFVATHSPHFLSGAIQSGADINIVRLTYQNKVGTARLLPQQRIRDLMRSPKYRSVGLLSALFANHVVVTEGDHDKALYEEIYVRRSAHDLGGVAANTIFLNARSKDMVPEIVQPLRELGIPTAAIVDLDQLKSKYNPLLTSACIPKARLSELSTSRAACLSIMQTAFSEEQSAERVRWRGGIDKLKGDDRDTLESLLNTLKDYGVFLVPKGELEDWLSDLQVTAKKEEGWLREVFEKLGEPGQDGYVVPSNDDVWAFIQDIEKWLRNPDRKGIPTSQLSSDGSED